jgi:hypothetical protein
MQATGRRLGPAGAIWTVVHVEYLLCSGQASKFRVQHGRMGASMGATVGLDTRDGRSTYRYTILILWRVGPLDPCPLAPRLPPCAWDPFRVTSVTVFPYGTVVRGAGTAEEYSVCTVQMSHGQVQELELEI